MISGNVRCITFHHFDADALTKRFVFGKVKDIVNFLPEEESTVEAVVDKKNFKQFQTTIGVHIWKKHIVAKFSSSNPFRSIMGAKKRIVRRLTDLERKKVKRRKLHEAK